MAGTFEGTVLQTLLTEEITLADGVHNVSNIDLKGFIGSGFFWLKVSANVNSDLDDLDILVQPIVRSPTTSTAWLTIENTTEQTVLEAANLTDLAAPKAVMVDLSRWFQDNGDEDIFIGGEGFRVRLLKTAGGGAASADCILEVFAR